jgi:hypothetical protein
MEKCGCDFCTMALGSCENCACKGNGNGNCETCKRIHYVHYGRYCLMQVAEVIDNWAYLGCVAHLIGNKGCVGCVVASIKGLSVCCYTDRFKCPLAPPPTTPPPPNEDGNSEADVIVDPPFASNFEESDDEEMCAIKWVD